MFETLVDCSKFPSFDDRIEQCQIIVHRIGFTIYLRKKHRPRNRLTMFDVNRKNGVVGS